jgi:cob(I)alamin adenosyltransferase
MTRSVVMINYGPGKGKTTAALGAALRAAGRNQSVFFLQFVKNRSTGETEALAQVSGVDFERIGAGMIFRARDLTPHRDAARRAWDEAVKRTTSGRYRLVVLDEILAAVQYDLIGEMEVIDLIQSRPSDTSLILTGRSCPPGLIDAADTVTWMEAVKHHLAAGVEAQAGIEH